MIAPPAVFLYLSVWQGRSQDKSAYFWTTKFADNAYFWTAIDRVFAYFFGLTFFLQQANTALTTYQEFPIFFPIRTFRMIPFDSSKVDQQVHELPLIPIDFLRFRLYSVVLVKFESCIVHHRIHTYKCGFFFLCAEKASDFIRVCR